MGILRRLFGPVDEDAFARLMSERLRRAGDTRESTYEREQFRLMFADSGKPAGMMNLRNLFEEFRRVDKDDRQAWWKKVVRGMLSHHKELPEEYDDAKCDLRPVVRPRMYLEAMQLESRIQGTEPWEPPHEPIGDHLVCCLVYDLPDSMQ